MFLKRFARDLYYGWSALAGRLQSREASMAGALTVLTYHRVLPDAEARACPFPALAMPETWFRGQMAWLSEKARVLPLDRALVDLEAEPDRDPRPRIAVTFDDGYADNFDVAAPILKRCGLRATFFICTAPVRSASHLWYDSIAEGTLRWGSQGIKGRLASIPLGGASDAHAIVAVLKDAPDAVRRAAVNEVERGLGRDERKYRSDVMTAEQIRGLAAAGHEIGSHTETHPIVPRLGATEAADELRRSKAWLEETIGKPVAGFCYPNGDHTPETRDWVAQAGYSYACLTEEGSHPPGADRFRIRRIDVAPNRVSNAIGKSSLRSFRATISQVRRSPRIGRA